MGTLKLDYIHFMFKHGHETVWTRNGGYGLKVMFRCLTDRGKSCECYLSTWQDLESPGSILSQQHKKKLWHVSFYFFIFPSPAKLKVSTDFIVPGSIPRTYYYICIIYLKYNNLVWETNVGDFYLLCTCWINTEYSYNNPM